MRWRPLTYSGWGRVLSATGEVARPERQSVLADLTRDAPAPALGRRRSYGDAALNDGGRAVDMTRLDRIIAFDPETGIVEVEAGLMIGDLARAFAPRGWVPAVMPGTGFATIGGCIANDVHGKNHHVTGTFGQHVLEFTLIRDGKARKVTPKGAPGLFRATLGGLGQTGIIATAKLQMMTCKGDLMLVTERRVSNWDEHVALLQSSPAHYAVGWVDARAGGASLGRGILEEGESGAGLHPRRRPRQAVPFALPLFSNRWFVRAFNEAYWRRVPAAGRTVVRPLDDFFFPLDKVHRINLAYGRAGFHQFQCVVPPDRLSALREILASVVQSRLASPLVVLKRTGPGRAGYLSFPMEGFTLAVDIADTQAARTLIGELNRMAAEAGGRIYFAKDSLATADQVVPMYDEIGEWRKAVARADPGRACETDLVRRLNLRGGP